jgi:hypothetical protein
VKLSLALTAASMLWLVAPPAFAGDDDPAPAPTVDIAPFKEKLRVFTDGKGHYLAFMPFTIGDSPIDNGYVFYGDGKTMWAQRRIGGGRDGKSSYSFRLWEPRGEVADVEHKDKKTVFVCEDRKTELTKLSAEDAQKIIDSATFRTPKWQKRAFALARDNKGVYYYVDRDREPEENRNFRVFKGPKGGLKAQKMVNVVMDANGTIFETKEGRLRLILDKGEQSWISGKSNVKLTPLDLGDNRKLIYAELGVYAGELYGTPCDDL